jgi:hypothetical protein
MLWSPRVEGTKEIQEDGWEWVGGGGCYSASGLVQEQPTQNMGTQSIGGSP